MGGGLTETNECIIFVCVFKCADPTDGCQEAVGDAGRPESEDQRAAECYRAGAQLPEDATRSH